jgi:hypothetical protein
VETHDTGLQRSFSQLERTLTYKVAVEVAVSVENTLCVYFRLMALLGNQDHLPHQSKSHCEISYCPNGLIGGNSSI